MQNLKNKINEQTLSQKQTHRYREHTDGCQKGEDGLGVRVGGGKKQVKEIKRYKLPDGKQMNQRDEMYRVGNTANE